MVRLAEGSAETTRSMMTVFVAVCDRNIRKAPQVAPGQAREAGLAGAMCGNCNVAMRY